MTTFKNYLKSFIRIVLSFLSFLIVASCLAALTYQCKTCIEKYLAKDSRVVIKVKSTGNTTFLAFTICPEYFESYKDDLLKKHNSSKEHIREVGNFSVMSTLTFDQITHEFNDIITKIKLTTGSRDRPTIDLYSNIDSADARFVPKYTLLFGRCFSMELLQSVTKLGIAQVAFTGKKSFYVYIHHPDQFFDLDTETKVEGRPGFRKYLDLNYEISENTLPEESEIPCNPDPKYVYDDCYDQTYRNGSLTRFGCIIPGLPPRYYNITEVCINLKTETMKEMMEYHEHYKSKRNCLIPCKTMEVKSNQASIDQCLSCSYLF